MIRNSVLTVVLALFATACGALMNTVEKPTVAVQSVAVGSVSLSGLSGQLNVGVTNPNSFGLPLESVDWELLVGNAQAVSGTVAFSRTIPAKGTTDVRVDVRVAARSAIAVAKNIASGNRQYQVRGVLHFRTRFGPIDVDFAGEGSLDDALALR